MSEVPLWGITGRRTCRTWPRRRARTGSTFETHPGTLHTCSASPAARKGGGRRLSASCAIRRQHFHVCVAAGPAHPPLSHSVTSEILAALSKDSRRVELADLDDRYSTRRLARGVLLPTPKTLCPGTSTHPHLLLEPGHGVTGKNISQREDLVLVARRMSGGS